MDELARKIETADQAAGVSDRAWLYHLARTELKRQARALEAQARESVSIDRTSRWRGRRGWDTERWPVRRGVEHGAPSAHLAEARQRSRPRWHLDRRLA